MIISASRRTDIPAYYSPWFFERLKAGFVLVRNPRSPHLVSSINLSPHVVDGIVLWTKNPLPMMDRLGELNGYPYYFQFTLTPYGTDIEPGLPSKSDVLLPAFQKLAETVGKDRVVWRYDPIIISGRYPADWHREQFRRTACRLSGCTEVCIVSFLDSYKNTKRNAEALGSLSPTDEQKTQLLLDFAATARECGMEINLCAEELNLKSYGIFPARCIDAGRLSRLGGIPLQAEKDKGQRPDCGCCASIDIGAYNTCPAGCRYCYANYLTGNGNLTRHDPFSPLLGGVLSEEDVVIPRRMYTLQDHQLKLFDNR